MKYRKRSSYIGCAFNEEAIERMLELKFKKKPVVVEARLLIDDMHVFEEIAKWCGGELLWDEGDPDEDGSPRIIIHTLEGDVRAYEGDWIIKGVEGEFYPCKNSIFKESYEQVDW